jgi:uncharacterized protein
MNETPLQFHPRRCEAASAPGATRQDPIIGHRVELQLLTTLKCNLKCSYCSLGVGDVLGSQTQVDYSIDDLVAFVDSTCRARRSTSPSTAASPR